MAQKTIKGTLIEIEMPTPYGTEDEETLATRCILLRNHNNLIIIEHEGHIVSFFEPKIDILDAKEIKEIHIPKKLLDCSLALAEARDTLDTEEIKSLFASLLC